MTAECFNERVFAEIEAKLGYRFQSRNLLEIAFTHSSYTAVTGERNNERLEFLGDAVLELVVTEMLVTANKDDEGKLTELRKQYVSQAALEQAEANLDLMQYLRFSGGENNVGGKTRSNLFEAVVGAIYLDGGLEAARKFLHATLVEIETENYKTLLQELVQDVEHITPQYSTAEEEGGYVCTVTALHKSACGHGASKKAAETSAAKALYTILIKRK